MQVVEIVFRGKRNVYTALSMVTDGLSTSVIVIVSFLGFFNHLQHFMNKIIDLKGIWVIKIYISECYAIMKLGANLIS